MRSLLTKRLHLANRQRSKLRAGALSIGGDVGKTIPDARQAAPGVKRGLTQAELEDQGFRLAGEGEIGLQLHAAVNRFNATADVTRVGFYRARLFAQGGQHGFCILLIAEHLTVGCGAIGVIHHGADIHAATRGGFLALHLLIASDMIGSPQGPRLSAQIAVLLTGTKPQNSAGILRFRAGNH